MASNLGYAGGMKIGGLEALRKALRELPEKIQSRVLSGAVAGGARVVLKEARARVRIDTGLLRRMLRATRGKRNGSEAAAFVTVRRLSKKKIAAYKRKTGKGSASNVLDPFYWSILEFGKSTRTAHPFIRPAFNATKKEAAEEIKKALQAGIEKEAKKLSWGRGAK